MNIFFLDEDPRQAAEWMVDRHILSQIRESALMLSTAHRVMDGLEVQLELEKDGKVRKKKVWVLDDTRNEIMYNAGHINHPSAVWVRQAVENYLWLVDHLFALSDEYTHRYGKKHATMTQLGYEIQSPPFALKDWDMTPMPCVMPDQYKISDNYIDNYRNYYKYGKADLHKWKKRDKPYWI
jgi:Pyrimidine dimer DNA glycosylase